MLKKPESTGTALNVLENGLHAADSAATSGTRQAQRARLVAARCCRIRSMQLVPWRQELGVPKDNCRIGHWGRFGDRIGNASPPAHSAS